VLNLVHCCAAVIANDSSLWFCLTGHRGALLEVSTEIQPRIMNMQSFDARDVRNNSVRTALANLAAVADVEWRVLEINKQIERQRQRVEELAFLGHDIASAAGALENLHVSLLLAVQDRHRVRAALEKTGSLRAA